MLKGGNFKTNSPAVVLRDREAVPWQGEMFEI
jgi:hypothetical protein